jgi:hypothetical protein
MSMRRRKELVEERSMVNPFSAKAVLRLDTLDLPKLMVGSPEQVRR